MDYYELWKGFLYLAVIASLGLAGYLYLMTGSLDIGHFASIVWPMFAFPILGMWTERPKKKRNPTQ